MKGNPKQCAKQVAAKRPYSNILSSLPLKAKVLAFLEFLSLDRRETVLLFFFFITLELSDTKV